MSKRCSNRLTQTLKRNYKDLVSIEVIRSGIILTIIIFDFFSTFGVGKV